MKKVWRKGCAVYQIYLQSFQTPNGNGIVDFPGITARIPYLR